MSSIKSGTEHSSSSFLRRVLMADGAISGAAGLIMFAGAGPLEGLLGVPSALLRYAGLSLFPWVAYVLVLATRARMPRGQVWSVIVLNSAWVVGSILLLVDGPIAPNAFGYTFILTQALAVAIIADLQYLGLRKSEVAV
jgi:hypothetical protein